MTRAAALLLVLSVSGFAWGSDAEDDAGVVWYQIEVLVFHQPRDGPPADEQFDYQPHRWIPGNVVALASDEPPHPGNLGQLLALRDHWAAKTRLALVTPGLDPEIEALIDWARRQARPVDRFRLRRELARDSILEVAPAESRLSPGEPPRGPEAALTGSGPTAESTGDAPAAEPADADDEAAPVPIELALRALDDRDLLLGAEAQRLARAGIRIAYHGGWRLPMAAGDEGLAVELDDDQGLLGFLEVTRRRFLHAHLVAWAREPQGFVEMNARVRMRRDETHLVDHPLLGALLRVERFHYQGRSAGDD